MTAVQWKILCVLFIARFALGFQFQSAGSVTPFLIEDFAIDYRQAGVLIGLFMLPGIFLAIASGYLGKRFGDKAAVLLGLMLMCIGGVAASYANGFTWLASGRLISGTGATILFVLMAKMVIDWFDRRTLFFAMSIFVLGWPIGIAAGQAVQPALADTQSWQLVFFLTSVGCLVAYTAVALAYRRPPSSDFTRSRPMINRRLGLSDGEFLLIQVAGIIWMCLNGAYVIFLSFGPILLLENGFSVPDSGLATSIISWSFMIALPLGGYVAYRFNAPNTVMIAGLSVATCAGAYAPYAANTSTAFALFGLALAFATPVIATLPARLLQPGNRAVGLGIYFAWHFVGAALLPILAGQLKDATGSATASLLLAAYLLLICLVLLLALQFAMGRNPYAPSRA